MKNIKSTLKNIWKDESAQGATEYILLLMIVVAIVLLFKDRIRGLVEGRLDSLGGGLGEVSTNF
ncbi:MAG: hypothetical protein H6625_04970 [Bdellovibrionaceae bacterium]|nr:hypothetical protein [Pseudobdellovibrionaceae bacterium]